MTDNELLTLADRECERLSQEGDQSAVILMRELCDRLRAKAPTRHCAQWMGVEMSDSEAIECQRQFERATIATTDIDEIRRHLYDSIRKDQGGTVRLENNTNKGASRA